MWYADFIEENHEELDELGKVAEYLDVKPLIDLVTVVKKFKKLDERGQKHLYNQIEVNNNKYEHATPDIPSKDIKALENLAKEDVQKQILTILGNEKYNLTFEQAGCCFQELMEKNKEKGILKFIPLIQTPHSPLDNGV